MDWMILGNFSQIGESQHSLVELTISATFPQHNYIRYGPILSVYMTILAKILQIILSETVLTYQPGITGI